MTDETRNFRSYYYDKVGFRGVEEKKSLETMLKERPIDLRKLSQFCLRFTVPSIYREQVWKLILGIESIYSTMDEEILQTTNTQEIAKTRREHFEYLYTSLRMFNVIENYGPSEKQIALLYCYETDPPNITKTTSDSVVQKIMAIAKVFINHNDNVHRGFWLTRNFLKHTDKFSDQMSSLSEKFVSILKHEDQELYTHLNKLGILKNSLFVTWFEYYFAEVLNEKVLEKIWDKIIGGTCKILPLLAASVLMTLRRTLLNLTTSEGVIKFLQEIPKDNHEAIVNQCLEMWRSKNVEKSTPIKKLDL